MLISQQSFQFLSWNFVIFPTYILVFVAAKFVKKKIQAIEKLLDYLLTSTNTKFWLDVFLEFFFYNFLFLTYKSYKIVKIRSHFYKYIVMKQSSTIFNTNLPLQVI